MHLIIAIKSNLLKISFFTMILTFITNSGLAVITDSLFISDKVIKMELRSDFSSIQEERTSDPEYHNGELIYYSPGGKATKISVRVRARGNFRLDPANCNFPPLLVDFKKNEVNYTIFNNQDKLKLVTPCQDEEDLIEEYTIYKMYNQITDFSLKVRLVKISYFDTGRDKEVFVKYSFFIEDKDHAAERNNAIEKDKFLTPSDLNEDNIKKLSFFQYMIGNKDWFINLRKNIVIMQPVDTTIAPYAVPYDFDFSDLINAEYTRKQRIYENLLTDRRIYQGLCYSEDEIRDILEFYQQLRPVFKSIISNQKLISKYRREEIMRYINQFYTIIENEELIKKEFLYTCETRADYNISD